MEDTFQYQGQRRQMVEKLREKKIADENVLRAIGAVPRQFFFLVGSISLSPSVSPKRKYIRCCEGL